MVVVRLEAESVFPATPSSSLAHGSNTLFAIAFIFFLGCGEDEIDVVVVPNRFSSIASNSSMDLLVRSGGPIRAFSGRLESGVVEEVEMVGAAKPSGVSIRLPCCFCGGELAGAFFTG